MTPRPHASWLSRTAFALLCVMWTGAGWAVLLAGQFSTRPIRSTVTTTVTGLGAGAMGLIFITLGGIALLLLLRSFSLSRWTQVMLALLWLVLAPWLLKGWLA